MAKKYLTRQDKELRYNPDGTHKTFKEYTRDRIAKKTAKAKPVVDEPDLRVGMSMPKTDAERALEGEDVLATPAEKMQSTPNYTIQDLENMAMMRGAEDAIKEEEESLKEAESRTEPLVKALSGVREAVESDKDVEAAQEIEVEEKVAIEQTVNEATENKTGSSSILSKLTEGLAFLAPVGASMIAAKVAGAEDAGLVGAAAGFGALAKREARKDTELQQKLEHERKAQAAAEAREDKQRHDLLKQDRGIESTEKIAGAKLGLNKIKHYENLELAKTVEARKERKDQWQRHMDLVKLEAKNAAKKFKWSEAASKKVASALKMKESVKATRNAIDAVPSGAFGRIDQAFQRARRGAGFKNNPDWTKATVSFQGVLNTILKERSGAAVSEQEYKRILGEVGNMGSWSKENLTIALDRVLGETRSEIRQEFKVKGEEVDRENYGKLVYSDPDRYKNIARFKGKTLAPAEFSKFIGTEDDAITIGIDVVQVHDRATGKFVGYQVNDRRQ